MSNDNKVLSKKFTAESITVPAGYKVNPVFDYWLHVQFCFNTGTGIEVEGWSITDSLGVEVSLSSLAYHEVQFLAQALAEEVADHQRSERYYLELEDAHFEASKYYFNSDRADEVQ